MKGKDERIDTLSRLIKKYQDSYYNGEAEISDSEFDLLWDELKNLSPDHPILKKAGADMTDGFPKAKHLIPMGSQDKAANPLEFRSWAVKTSPASFVVQYKLDGASLELQYETGILKKAVTRGDGITGDEITQNAILMKGVQKEISKSFSGGVRGEVIMTHRVWESGYKDKANCRNAANGIMRRKDGTGCDDLDFISYDAASSNDDAFFKNEIEKITWLKKQGFNATETKEFLNIEEVIAYRNVISDKRKSLGFDIDGLVVKDIITDMADLRRTRPERQIAFKFDLEMAYSILRKVEWSESGATYTPIGIVDPVRLAGTTVKRANLNNPGMIRSLGLKIGSAVTVVKRGEIIPKIEGLAPLGVIPEADALEEITFPEKCSTCNSTLEDSGTRLFCPNSLCSKKLHHRLEKWVNTLDIRELGEKLLKQLFDSGRVRIIPDLYTLTENELSLLERMGELSSAKVIRHIQAKRELSLATFIAGFDFEGVGELIIEKVVSAGFDTLIKLRAASLEELSNIYGIGEITAGIILNGLKETAIEMDEVISKGVISITPSLSKEDLPLKEKSFCFTGELKTMKRNRAEEMVKALGGTVKSSVVKELTFLVTNDTGSGSSKNKKANDLGIKILSEEEFISLLSNKKNNYPQEELF